VKLATYRAIDDAAGAARLGAVGGDAVVPLDDVALDLVSLIAGGADALGRARGAAASGAGSALSLERVRLLAPLVPQRNAVCVGLNYAEHVQESKSVAGTDAPKYPVFFTKPPTCVIGPDDEIPWHGHVSTAIDWEVELAVIIGRRGRDIDERAALDYVFGYTVANDVTARDLQQRHGQWYKGKALDGFCPLGPAVLTADEVADPQTLDICLRVNGAEKQRASTRQMIFGVARLIADWSAGMTLLPGDLLLTGTPAGVGIGRTPPEFLEPGDVVEAEVAGIGVLRNTVARGAGAS
jgi:2-keto-4-pentenoate hydratase/2-oxohepta-3-ene-1,7-dioic acid hydratase in catechol pathway